MKIEIELCCNVTKNFTEEKFKIVFLVQAPLTIFYHNTIWQIYKLMAQTNPKLRHFYDLLSETIIANLDEIITFFSTNFSCLDFLWEDYFAEKILFAICSNQTSWNKNFVLPLSFL